MTCLKMARAAVAAPKFPWVRPGNNVLAPVPKLAAGSQFVRSDRGDDLIERQLLARGRIFDRSIIQVLRVGLPCERHWLWPGALAAKLSRQPIQSREVVSQTRLRILIGMIEKANRPGPPALRNHAQ